MKEENENRHFYDQDDQPLRRSKTPKFADDEEKPLRRSQAQDDDISNLWKKIGKKSKDDFESENDLDENNNEENEENLSRVDQIKRQKIKDTECKTKALSRKLNAVIFILIGLIILTYLIMRFVNF